MAYGNNTDLPGFDVDIEGSIPMSGTAGKVSLTSSTDALECGTSCANDPNVVDFLGWGDTNDQAGSGSAPSTTNATSVSRDESTFGTGSYNTADNAADFSRGTPTPQPSGSEGGGEDPDPTDPPEDPEFLEIAEIQGTGFESPVVGQTVTTVGVVTAAFPQGGLNGYHIQTPGTGGELDDDHDASHGLFMYAPAINDLELEQCWEVTGTISEYNEMTQIQNVTLAQPEEECAPVTPAEVEWPADEEGREALEAMLLAPQGDYTVTNTYSSPTGVFGEVGLAFGDAPLVQPTEVARPNSPEAADVEADNEARRIILDDARTANFANAPFNDEVPSYITQDVRPRVGAAVTFEEPVVLSTFQSTWRFYPQEPIFDGEGSPVVFEDTRTTAPELADGDTTVAAFNVLNYFVTHGDEIAGCQSYEDKDGNPIAVRTGCDPRGAWNGENFERQQAKIVAAINATGADVVGLMEIENSARVQGADAADEAVQNLAEALNADLGENVWAHVESSDEVVASAASQDVITNAIIYRTDTVEPVGDMIALLDESHSDGIYKNAREPLGQQFQLLDGDETFTVVVNHLKSKSAGGATGDNLDIGDGQGGYNGDRTRQAEAQVEWLNELFDRDEPILVMGDINSYAMEDPMQVFYEDGYVNAATEFDVDGWSYSFGGMSGSLDHILLNESALDVTADADIWTINAPEVNAQEYSLFNYYGYDFYDESLYRSSDHDPVLVSLTFPSDEPTDEPTDPTDDPTDPTDEPTDPTEGPDPTTPVETDDPTAPGEDTTPDTGAPVLPLLAASTLLLAASAFLVMRRRAAME